MVLSPEQVRSYYDHFGRRQDSQSFYEDPATSLLLEHGHFEEAHAVFELGAGTGRFADEVLSRHASSDCSYRGIDISPTMVGIAEERLRKYGHRVSIDVTAGETRLSEDDDRYDRFVVNYVLDLMSGESARALIGEARRILKPDGLLCMVSLTHGRTPPTRIVSGIWSAVYAVNARLVGGCRPIELRTMITESTWQIEYNTTIASFGLTSEVLIARKPR